MKVLPLHEGEDANLQSSTTITLSDVDSESTVSAAFAIRSTNDAQFLIQVSADWLGLTPEAYHCAISNILFVGYGSRITVIDLENGSKQHHRAAFLFYEFVEVREFDFLVAFGELGFDIFGFDGRHIEQEYVDDVVTRWSVAPGRITLATWEDDTYDFDLRSYLT